MFTNNILENARTIIVSDLQNSLGFSFEHRHDYVEDGYSVKLEIRTCIDPNSGKFSPLITLNQHITGNPRPSVFRMANDKFFSVNGVTEQNRTLYLSDSEFETQMIEHGYSLDEIQLIRSINFTIKLYMDRQ